MKIPPPIPAGSFNIRPCHFPVLERSREGFMIKKAYVIGVDYGTDSVRSVLVNALDGKTVASAVFDYPRWKKGLFCDPSKNQFRQHPLDYVEGLEKTIKQVLAQAPNGIRENIRGISVDTTGSTPVPVDKTGAPLALSPEFAKNPNAMFVLWKDHTAVQEAAEINRTAKSWGGIDFTQFEGGIYSSEWFWAKILHVLRSDKKVEKAAYSWMEHCDWIPALLTGDTDPLAVKRSRCAAGHKAMWHESWGGLPSDDFLRKLDSRLGGLRDRLYRDTFTADIPAGTISRAWAKKLGLSQDVVIGTGSFDAHMGAVGAEIKPYILCKIMGTSTCDMLVAPAAELKGKLIRGICGQVEGSIIPGMLGMEAGQSSFGDVYAWFKDLLSWPLQVVAPKVKTSDKKAAVQWAEAVGDGIISELSKAASAVDLADTGITALDWLNGRRTPDADQNLKAAITGLNLGSDAPKIFRALVEATAFGARKINDRFISEGVPIKGVIAIGGVSKKSPFVMQVMADVLGMPIQVAKSEQACALGAAMCASVAAGVHTNLKTAQKIMGSGFDRDYKPNPGNVKRYSSLYDKYSKLGAYVEAQTHGESV
jgi:L-ribulokinase